MLTSKIFRLLRSSNGLRVNRYANNFRNTSNNPKPSQSEGTQEEDVYEKMCREEKERIKKRDEESANEMKVKSLPVKLLTYGALIVVNYYVFKTGYEYFSSMNTAADKTSSLK